MDPGFPRALGETLRKMRRERGLTQEQLYFESEIHRTLISQWERAVYLPSIENLVDLAAALGTSPAEILRQAEAQLAANMHSRKPQDPPKLGRPKGT